METGTSPLPHEYTRSFYISTVTRSFSSNFIILSLIRHPNQSSQKFCHNFGAQRKEKLLELVAEMKRKVRVKLQFQLVSSFNNTHTHKNFTLLLFGSASFYRYFFTAFVI